MSGNAYYSGKQTAKMTQQKTERTHHGPPRLGAWLLLSCAAACGGSTRKLPSVGSESHFLAHCEATCDAGLDCIGGICTRSCLTEQSSCSDLASAATCTNQSVEPGQVAVCDVSCAADANCRSLGDGYDCKAGFCRQAGSFATEPIGSAGAGGASTAGGNAADCESFRDQSPPPDVRAISIRNTGTVPLYLFPIFTDCITPSALVQVERDGLPVNVMGIGICDYGCQQIMDEGWPYGDPSKPVRACPAPTCRAPELVRIEPGQALEQPAGLEVVPQRLPRACAEGIRSETLDCSSRVIPQPGAYTLTVYAAVTLNCDPASDCGRCSFDTHGICSNFASELLEFKSHSPWYFQNQELSISAPLD
jgi:hypothetical protein